MKREEREQEIRILLRTRMFNIPNGLLERFSAEQVKTIHTYLTDVPRITPVGRELTQRDAIRIVGVSLRDGKDPWNAMRFDSIDGRANGGIDTLLAKYGMPGLPQDASSMTADEVLKLTAVLHADEVIFEHLHYRKDKSQETLLAFIDMVQRRPTQADGILRIARSRQSLDVDLIEGMLDSEAKALVEGAL